MVSCNIILTKSGFPLFVFLLFLSSVPACSPFFAWFPLFSPGFPLVFPAVRPVSSGRTTPSPGLLAPGAHVPHRERGAQPHHGRGARGRGASESKWRVDAMRARQMRMPGEK